MGKHMIHKQRCSELNCYVYLCLGITLRFVKPSIDLELVKNDADNRFSPRPSRSDCRFLPRGVLPRTGTIWTNQRETGATFSGVSFVGAVVPSVADLGGILGI